jgi:hypothetical protein
MNQQSPYLQLSADDWSSCLDESLQYLHASWSQSWMGLPLILLACMDFLELNESTLSASANSMLTAALAIASDSELRCSDNKHLDEPKFHNRLHTADVITAMTLQMAIETKLSGSREPDWLAAGLLMAVGHDFMHSGGVNASESQIEILSCTFIHPYLLKYAVPQVWVQRIETAIVRSDLALTAHNHRLVQGAEFQWNQAWLNVLLNEADILPSTNPALGPSWSEALSREWMFYGFEGYKTVATRQGREAFLRSAAFSSASSRVLQAPQRCQAQLQQVHA